MRNYDALALFSGGLDSILAAKTVMAQGKKVLCLHFVSPFFGKPGKIRHWREIYGLDIQPVDVGEDYIRMIAAGPRHGLGKFLNPCIDCKIFMLTRAKAMLEEYGAKCILSGEVLGQRPMSQRIDALHIISRDAAVRDVLVRPLCARRLPATPVEESGFIDRERLHDVHGRGRREQMRLAEEFGLTEIPTPAGGCMLTEMESVRRYFPIFKHLSPPRPADFELSNIGRQHWAGKLWLSIGRNQSDNARLEALFSPEDLVFKTVDFPGPLAVGRRYPGSDWDEAAIRDAAAYVASFSPKAVRFGRTVQVNVAGFAGSPVEVVPTKETALGWREPTWEEALPEKRAMFGADQEDDHAGR